MRYLADPRAAMDAIWDDVLDRMGWLEAQTSRTFGHGPHPLLVSVRSGATQSMPGMMDTILDLGMNDEAEQALAADAPAFARDTRLRFDRMYRRIDGLAEHESATGSSYIAASSNSTYASMSGTAVSAACTLIAMVSPMPCTPCVSPIAGDNAG